MVLRLVAAIDYDLERCLKHKFRKLNTRTEKRIFGTYGPLSTFAARSKPKAKRLVLRQYANC